MRDRSFFFRIVGNTRYGACSNHEDPTVWKEREGNHRGKKMKTLVPTLCHLYLTFTLIKGKFSLNMSFLAGEAWPVLKNSFLGHLLASCPGPCTHQLVTSSAGGSGEVGGNVFWVLVPWSW